MTPDDTKLHALRFVGNHGWDAAIEIDGHPLKMVSSLEISVHGGGIPKAILTIDIIPGLEHEMPTDIQVIERHIMPRAPRFEIQRRWRVWRRGRKASK